MQGFTIRVVLYGNAPAQTYALLDDRLSSIGVVDDILADSGDWYKMPPGEYVHYDDTTGEAVRDMVAAAVGPVWANSAVFVTEGSKRFWQGLKRIPAPI